MIFSFDLTLSKSTIYTPVSQFEMKLCAGVIHKIDIVFPSGCMGLVSVGIFNALNKVWPTNSDKYFAANDEIITFREHHIFDVEPYTLYLQGWNDDDTFDHTITVRFGVLPKSVIAPWLMSYADRLSAALGGE